MVTVHERIASTRKIVADYDSSMDVLYIAIDPPKPGEGEDRSDGIVLRYGIVDGAPIGVTVVGYRAHRWQEAIEKLAEIVAGHLSVSPPAVAEAIERAVKRR